MISERYPHILNIRCIAHFVNLITKDIISYDFSKKLLKKCNKIIKFFNKSHQVKALLDSYIQQTKIEGGGLKTYSKTRWTSMYDTVLSIIRLQPCFQLVSDVQNLNILLCQSSNNLFVRLLLRS